MNNVYYFVFLNVTGFFTLLLIVAIVVNRPRWISRDPIIKQTIVTLLKDHILEVKDTITVIKLFVVFFNFAKSFKHNYKNLEILIKP